MGFVFLVITWFALWIRSTESPRNELNGLLSSWQMRWAAAGTYAHIFILCVACLSVLYLCIQRRYVSYILRRGKTETYELQPLVAKKAFAVREMEKAIERRQRSRAGEMGTGIDVRVLIERRRRRGGGGA